MKVCFIVGAFPKMKCGIGDYTYNIALELTKFNVEVHIITSIKANVYSNDKMIIHNVVEEWTFKSSSIIMKTLTNISPDIVHIQYPSDEYGKSFFINLLPKIIKNKLNVKVVETVHEYLNYTIKGRVRNLINYIYSDKVIVVEKEYNRLIKSFLPIISKKIDIKYIPIASNIPVSKLTIEGIKLKRDELCNNSENIISFFGFINELKGIEVLIEAISMIKKINKDIKLLIIGNLDYNNYYHAKILKMIEDFELTENIIMTGFLESPEEVADYLKISDCAVFPFKNGVSERNGSFLAAHNQNIPIITTSLNNSYNKDGIFYLKNVTCDSLYKEIVNVINNKSNINRDILEWDNIVEKHYELYLELED